MCEQFDNTFVLNCKSTKKLWFTVLLHVLFYDLCTFCCVVLLFCLPIKFVVDKVVLHASGFFIMNAYNMLIV